MTAASAGLCTFETFGTGTESSVVAVVALLSELVDVLLIVWSGTVSPTAGTVPVVVG